MLFRKHFKSIFLILSIVLITGCFGLSRKDEGVSKDYLAKQAKSEKAKQEKVYKARLKESEQLCFDVFLVNLFRL